MLTGKWIKLPLADFKRRLIPLTQQNFWTVKSTGRSEKRKKCPHWV